MSKEIPKPSTFTLDFIEFNRITVCSKENPDVIYVYDGRGYKFVQYPTTGDVLKEPREKIGSSSVGTLYGMSDLHGDKAFVIGMADCFDPPLYLIMEDNESEAVDCFQTDFEELIKVENVDQELFRGAVSLCVKSGQVWENLTKEAQDGFVSKAENALIDSGQWTYNGNGTVVHSEGIIIIPVEILKAERMPVVKEAS